MAWQRTSLLGFLTCVGLLNFARVEAAVATLIAIPLWLTAVGDLLVRSPLPAPQPQLTPGSRSTAARRLRRISMLSTGASLIALCYLAVPAFLR